MDWAPFVRIFLRYLAGAIGGAGAVNALSTDLNLENALVMAVSAGTGAAVEWLYAKARARGWAT